ncbi:acetate--CoA ligase [Saccharolobus solfataricus]|uniref:Acetate--CoA ligase n=3 Tax=Saccharolobus solfataricus TaxID=2287 RepID=Q97U22_SACS2|nr:acetate--CoA ligase [Saccharolobus solfataricus]AAK43300.1 Acetyl-CoA synthetase (acetate-CoA ligase) (acsA-10) [Saccharolobus solfataricus P2]AKA73322.1 acetate--CoA ligase [Saccharolobus solfataricus]AKA76021.1 acetate--CoA ligase [Saccharolobus solfataricus]AKA78714.1 acetate--CoA ligase [Saccharolobus solfataricus]AZF67789.1 acetate--CoA ligase [Saccharolobus solfataricus]
MVQEITENIKEIEEKVDYNTRIYREIYRESIENPGKFWGKLGEDLIDWFEPWKEIYKQETLTKWFLGGKLNASYNAIDRHLNSSRKFKAAIIWESEKGERKILTYQDLFYEVNRWANALKQLGVKKGDRVTIYMPLTPEGVTAMLACARIGAIHSVVFAGFGSQALADRIADAQSKIVITADGYYRKGRLIELKKTVDDALSKLQDNSVKNIIIFRRIGIEIPFKEGRDVFFDEIGKYKYIEPEPVEATHPLFILYTSGTTGKPKGIVHSTGGYLVGTATMLLWSYGLSQENDVLFNTSDIGWIVGHSYITYSPLVMGRSVVIYESAPDYPTPDKWAELIEKYKATTFGTSATFLRYLMKYGEDYIKAHDLSSLRIIVTNGEPLNYAPWKYGLEIIGKGRVFMSHQWWQTETGAPNLGYMPGYPIFLTMKSGPASGFPLPGNKIKVVDENGNPTRPRERGYLIIEPPFPPMMMIGMWNDDGNERVIKTYFSKFPNLYYTGDFAMIDEDGYVWVSGRADETLKIAGHRIGAGEVESAITSHPAVAEAAVIGIPDPVKGEIAHAFVVLKQGYHQNNELSKEIQEHVRKIMGPIVLLEVHFVNALPKTRSGKVMRRVIKAVMTGSNIGDISTLEDEASMEEIKKAIEVLRRQLNP